MMDTARLFPIILTVNIIHGLILFIAIPSFPFAIASLIIYTLALNSVRDTSGYLNLVYIAFLIDLFTLVYLRFYTLAPLTFVPLFILIVLYYLLNHYSKQELNIFGRTIQSYNEKDRRLARKAKKTKDIDDISKVASYKSWQSF